MLSLSHRRRATIAFIDVSVERWSGSSDDHSVGRRHWQIGSYSSGDAKLKEAVVDRIDRRVWYGVVAVVVLLLLAWLFGWFGGAEAPPTATNP